jgi:hypothetical protein
VVNQPDRGGAKMVGARLALAACLMLAACATKPKPPPAMPAMTPAGSLTLFEGGCFYISSCDTYTLTLRPDGAYTLKQRKGAAPETTKEGKLPAQTFADAEAVLRESRFGAMPERMNGSDLKVWKPDVYPCMPHAPGWRLTRDTGDGNVREVYWDLGCRSEAMNAFTAKLDAAMKKSEVLK